MKQVVNRVIKWDLLSVMENIPDGCVDMVLCDLPYGNTRNPWDKCIDLVRLWELYKWVLAERGVVVLISQGMFTAVLIVSHREWFKYKLVWIKSQATHFLNAKKQPLRSHEDICFFYKSQPPYWPQMSSGKPYKTLRGSNLTGNYHTFIPLLTLNEASDRYPLGPNQKPVALGRYLIRTYIGAIVLDNACGSGFFLVSAILENRQFIGIEKNKDTYLYKTQPIDFIAVGRQRVEAVRKEQQSLLIKQSL